MGWVDILDDFVVMSGNSLLLYVFIGSRSTRLGYHSWIGYHYLLSYQSINTINVMSRTSIALEAMLDRLLEGRMQDTFTQVNV